MPVAWNADFESVGGEDFVKATTSPSFYRMFLAAENERSNAAAQTALAVPAAGDPALGTFSGAAGTAWPGLQQKVRLLAPYFVRAKNDDGTPYVWEGTSGIDACDRRYQWNGVTWAASPLVFPSPNGFRRRWRRTIYTTSQAGTNGERARFSYRNNTKFYQVPTTDPLFNTTVTTPAGQEANTGKYFDRVGGAWVLSADQTTDADIVEQTNAPGTYPDDLFMGYWLNDLRDALNQMTRTVGHTQEALPLFNGISVTATFGTDLWDGGAGDAAGELWVGGGPDKPTAEADYAASGGSGFSVLEALAYTTWDEDGFGADTFGMNRENRYISNSSAMPNAGGLTRRVSYWGKAEPADEWSAQGNDVLNDVWHQMGATTDTAATAIHSVSRLFGDADPTLAWPTVEWPAAKFNSRGWGSSARRAALVVDWAVAGGFSYTEST